MNRTCAICGQPKSSSAAGSFTQWVSLCRCEELEAGSNTQMICVVCGKRIEEVHAGSFTQWVLQSQHCSCPKPVPFGKAIEPGFSNTRPADAAKGISDIADIDETSFPRERYKPLNKLGIGGAGSVFQCFDNKLQKQVAVKVLRQTSEQQLELFQSEAKVTARLRHPNVVSIIDFGTVDGKAPYMVLEYIDGKALSTMLEEHGRLDQRLAVDLFVQIADGLAKAHEQDIFHRDVKSSNIIVGIDEQKLVTAYIIDFGIAVVAESETVESGRALIGTPKYMSPDQLLGREFDARSEIYSLGCVMYEVITGRVPFLADESLALLNQHAQSPVPFFSEVANDLKVSTGLEDIIRRCLEKDPEARYQSMRELIGDLESSDLLQEIVDIEQQEHEPATDGAPSATPAGEVAPAGKQVKMSRSAKLLAGVAALALVGVPAMALRLFFTHESFPLPADTAATTKKQQAAEKKRAIEAITRQKQEASLDKFLEGKPLDPACEEEDRAITLGQERYRALETEYTTKIASSPNTAVLFRLRGQARKYQGKYDLALNDFEQACKLAPDDAANYRAIAELYENPVEPAKAMDNIARASAADPTDYKNPLFVGDMYAQLQPELALKYVEHAILLNDKAAEPYAVRALCHFKSGNRAQARKDAHRAQVLDPDNAVVYSYLGEMLKDDDQETAMSFFRKAAKIDPLYYKSYWFRSGKFVLTGDPNRAMDSLSKAIRLNPWNSTFYHARAMAYDALAQPDNALADSAAAIKLNPKNSIYHEMRGHLWMEKNEIEKGFEQYNKAIALGGGSAKLWFRMGTRLADQNNYPEALKSLSKCLELGGQGGRAYMARAKVYAKLGENQKAIDDYTAYLKIKPSESTALAERADLYDKIGKPELAKKDRSGLVQSFKGIVDSTYQASTSARTVLEKTEDIEGAKRQSLQSQD